MDGGCTHHRHRESWPREDADQKRVVPVPSRRPTVSPRWRGAMVTCAQLAGPLPWARYSRQAVVEMVNLGGTGRPSLVISARLAPLPRSRSLLILVALGEARTRTWSSVPLWSGCRHYATSPSGRSGRWADASGVAGYPCGRSPGLLAPAAFDRHFVEGPLYWPQSATSPTVNVAPFVSGAVRYQPPTPTDNGRAMVRAVPGRANHQRRHHACHRCAR